MTQPSKRFLAALAVVTLVETPALAQEASPPAAAPQTIFRTGVELVRVAASVYDQRGRPVRGLGKADFEVLDGGRPRPIRDFYAGESAISLAVVLDISGSMAVGGNMDRARDAIAVAMRGLRDDDEAAFLTFDSSLQQVVDFTRDLDRIRRISLEGMPWGETSLYDAIARAAEAAGQQPNRHRAVLVITDGADTASKLTAAEVSGIAAAIDVPVYVLAVANPVDHVGTEWAVGDGGPNRRASLVELSRWTGGDFRMSSAPAHTVGAIGHMLGELRHQYLITFEPGETEGWHPIEIRTRQKTLVVRARGGYLTDGGRDGGL
jgi:Ca-activated chloride channel family protein